MRYRMAVWLITAVALMSATVVAGQDFREFAVNGQCCLQRGIVRGADGNMWFTERENIGRITPAGEIT